MQNIKMTIAYDGRRYMGFTVKKENQDKSIQGKFEMILEKLYESPVEVIGAVNTDAGVHAKHQVINFVVKDDRLDVEGLREYFEKYLPDDIIVMNAEAVDERFHSRYNVKMITYEYRLWKVDAPTRPLFERQYVNVQVQHLDVYKMKEAAIDFIGDHDFTAFTTNSKIKSPIKSVKAVKITETDQEIIIQISANGFLLNMERLMVGTLIQVGLGQLPMHTIERALSTQKSENVGHKAMAGALCLIDVIF